MMRRQPATRWKRDGQMPSDEQGQGGKRHRGRPPRKSVEPTAGDAQTETPPPGTRVLAAFRIPRELHSAMAHEAHAEGLDLTAWVNRLFDGFLHHFGLPGVVADQLEQDRHELGLRRHEYLQHVLFKRYEAVAQEGAGFDRPERRDR